MSIQQLFNLIEDYYILYTSERKTEAFEMQSTLNEYFTIINLDEIIDAYISHCQQSDVSIVCIFLPHYIRNSLNDKYQEFLFKIHMRTLDKSKRTISNRVLMDYNNLQSIITNPDINPKQKRQQVLQWKTNHLENRDWYALAGNKHLETKKSLISLNTDITKNIRSFLSPYELPSEIYMSNWLQTHQNYDELSLYDKKKYRMISKLFLNR